MKRPLVFVLLAMVAIPTALFGQGASPGAAMKRDIAYLASDLLDGRATGSAGNDSAALYIARTYQRLGLAGAFHVARCDQNPGCPGVYFERFKPPASVLEEANIRSGTLTENVAALIPGTDSALRSEYIVLGAHFDHLGRTGLGALDRATRYAPHLGADDNASGTAAVMELARRFAANPTRRSILVVNFGAEELGEWGSIFFVQYPPGPLDSVVAMVNFDMVGHLLAKRLEVFGVSTSPQWAGLLKGAATEQGMKLDLHDETVPRGYGSDHEAFAEAGIPVAHFYTGTHPAYHTAEDRPGIIDIDGMVRVVGLAESIIRTIGDSSAVLTPATRPHGKR